MPSFSGIDFPILFIPSQVYSHSFLSQAIANLDRRELRLEYQKLRTHAPRRFSSGRSYFGNNHFGIGNQSTVEKRFEQHLEKAIWRENVLQIVFGDSIEFLDYQFPLKATNDDTGIGEVDLLGLSNIGKIIVTELKVKKLNSRPKNTPLAVLMQGIRYAAIVDRNSKDIANEIKKKFGKFALEHPPVVQILAPKNWWNFWLDLDGLSRKRAGPWECEFDKLIDDINGDEQIGIAIKCLTLDDVGPEDLDYGPRRNEPRLKRKLSLYFVRPSEKPSIIGDAKANSSR